MTSDIFNLSSGAASEHPVFDLRIDAADEGAPKPPHRDPLIAEFVSWLESAPVNEQAKVVGVLSGAIAEDTAVRQLASRISLAAAKRGVRVNRRTLHHPEDKALPPQARRKIVALWRAPDEPAKA